MRLLDFSRALHYSYHLEAHIIEIAELSKNYRDDFEFMSIVCANTRYPSISLASEDLLDNEDFLLSICYKNGDIACFVIFQCSERLQYNVEFIQKLIDFCPNSICNANQYMKTHGNLLLYAIEKGADSRVLDLLELLGNDEAIIKALKINPSLYAHAPDRIKANRQLLLFLINIAPTIVSDLSSIYKNDYDIISAFLNSPNHFIQELKNTYYDQKCNNIKIMALLLQIDGTLLTCANDILKNDEHIVKLAVTNNGIAIQYANKRFTDTLEIALIAMKSNPEAYHFLGSKIKYMKQIRKLM